ncbi:MAG: hypothetical protein CMQ49_03610 [Gammaproteobacteria bacterium]|nr:hypothetical protein [Gammaproteobacteria bacterium]
MTATAQAVAALLGVLIAGACLWGMLASNRLIGVARRLFAGPVGMPLAVGVRIVFGAALLVSAPVVRYTLVFQVLGVGSLVGAAVIPLAGRRFIDGLLDRLARMPRGCMVACLAFGMLFGLWLAFASYLPP